MYVLCILFKWYPCLYVNTSAACATTLNTWTFFLSGMKIIHSISYYAPYHRTNFLIELFTTTKYILNNTCAVCIYYCHYLLFHCSLENASPMSECGECLRTMIFDIIYVYDVQGIIIFSSLTKGLETVSNNH